MILLEGFGSDQMTMTSLASEFARSGWHVFTFDFSGHGRSPSTLTFDNAQTELLANQALSALEEFKLQSGSSTSPMADGGLHGCTALLVDLAAGCSVLINLCP